MTSVERMRAALAGRAVDRPPVPNVPPHVLRPLLADRLEDIGIEQGSAQQVREHVRATLAELAGCTRLIIGAGCALPMDTKPENIAVLMEEIMTGRFCDRTMQQTAVAVPFNRPVIQSSCPNPERGSSC